MVGAIAPDTFVSDQTSFCHAWFSSPGSCQFEFRLGRPVRSRFGLLNRWSKKVMNVNVTVWEVLHGKAACQACLWESTCLDTVYCHFNGSWWSQAVWTCTKLVFCNCNLGCNRYLHTHIYNKKKVTNYYLFYICNFDGYKMWNGYIYILCNYYTRPY